MTELLCDSQNKQTNKSLTFSRGVAQNFVHLLVGGVLSQSAHDVSDLVVRHLVVTHPVEQTEGLPVVCGVEGRDDSITLMNPIILSGVHLRVYSEWTVLCKVFSLCCVFYAL